ncbi:lyase [Thalassotalea litorea]|uniref:Lyase n=1 Tax=Thalassotalea litorea TaxID=2020715 RepID=A0A5R9IJB9_9GAMM|nr:lyase [Thalassotalea litorea]TLU64177.1 lyase [Thalassotalea litorea]
MNRLATISSKVLLTIACLYILSLPLLAFESTPQQTHENKAETKGKSNIEIKEWTVPWPDTRPRDPAVDSKGVVWFCGQVGNYIASLDPKTGKFKQFELPNGTYPHNLIIDNDDFIWYAGNRNSHIGRLDPTSGDIERIEMPSKNPIDPHTLVFDTDNNIWFTAQWGNKVGRLNVNDRKVDLVDSPLPESRPYGIKIDSNNQPWIVLFGTNILARVDAESLQFSLYSLPQEQQRPRRLEIDAQDQVWYLDHESGYLGRYQPKSQRFSQWLLPEKDDANLYGSAIDSQQRIWLAVTGISPNQLRVFDIESESFVDSVTVASGGGTIRYMYYHKADDTVWFGTDSNTIGRAKLK